MNRKKLKLKWYERSNETEKKGVMSCGGEPEALNHINKQVNGPDHSHITVWTLEDHTGKIMRTWQREKGDASMPEAVVGTLK